MALYSTGTVTVTNGSTTVQGDGTAWFGLLQTGWMFVGPDGRAIGIADVVDNTTLSLTKPYLGPTASVQGYECFPTMSLAGDLAAAFQDVASEFQGMIDGVGQGKFPDGTLGAPGIGFVADPDTGLRRVGANGVSVVAGGADQLTLTGGLATGSVVTQSKTDTTTGRLVKVGDFGLGSVTAVKQYVDLEDEIPAGFAAFLEATVAGYDPSGSSYAQSAIVGRGGAAAPGVAVWAARLTGNPATIQPAIGVRSSQTGPLSWARLLTLEGALGTVSQSGGVPTGAIIERAANANGEYVRFADGTQICHGTVAPDFTATANQIFDYPAAFAATPSGGVQGPWSGSPTAITNWKSVEVSGGAGGLTFFVNLDGTGSNGSGGEFKLSYTFIGRWF